MATLICTICYGNKTKPDRVRRTQTPHRVVLYGHTACRHHNESQRFDWLAAHKRNASQKSRLALNNMGNADGYSANGKQIGELRKEITQQEHVGEVLA